MKVIEMPLHSYQAIRDLKVDIDLEKNIIVFGDKGMTVIKDPDSEIIDGRLFNGGHCAIAVVQCPNEIHLYLINSKDGKLSKVREEGTGLVVELYKI
jgi:hypothetical protein